MFRKLSVRLGLALAATTIILMSVFTWYFVARMTEHSRQIVFEKGTSAARTGALSAGLVLDNLIDSGAFTVDEVFDRSLVPVEMPKKITDGYSKATDKEKEHLRRFHYASGLDSCMENLIVNMEDSFLEDPQIEYAVLFDMNRYVPVHNSKFNRMPTGEYQHDLDFSREKRVYKDITAMKAAASLDPKCLLQEYRRDSGELMWDIACPVFVKGRHWGVFRAGLSMQKIEAYLASIRNRMFLAFGIFTVIMSALVILMTEFMMRTKKLPE